MVQGECELGVCFFGWRGDGMGLLDIHHCVSSGNVNENRVRYHTLLNVKLETRMFFPLC